MQLIALGRAYKATLRATCFLPKKPDHPKDRRAA
jgi:hypothetical protein